MLFTNKTVFITGASRGIGKAIALRLAREGANIIVAAKSVAENIKLGGTIFSAAKEIEKAGGKALPVQCDIRFEDQIRDAVDKGVQQFGGIDILVNNASAISLTPTEQTEPKKFDLIHDINVRGTFFVTKACIPHLKTSTNAHILTLSPPVNMNPKWFSGHVAYTLSKYSMSMMAIGWAAERRSVEQLVGRRVHRGAHRRPRHWPVDGAGRIAHRAPARRRGVAGRPGAAKGRPTRLPARPFAESTRGRRHRREVATLPQPGDELSVLRGLRRGPIS